MLRGAPTHFTLIHVSIISFTNGFVLLFVMRPHANDFYRFLLMENLIYKPVFYCDAAGVRAEHFFTDVLIPFRMDSRIPGIERR